MQIDNSIKDIVVSLEQSELNSLFVLSIPHVLNDELANKLLIQTGIANGNSNEIISRIKSFPIWCDRNRDSWCIDDEVREYAFHKLNGSRSETRRNVLSAMNTIAGNLKEIINQQYLILQISRLSLTLEEEQKTGINNLRLFFDAASYYQNEETLRVVDLYIEENIPFVAPDKIIPDHLQSAYLMRGLYAYKNKNFDVAISFLLPAWKKRSDSYQSKQDAAIAAHIVGVIWSKNRSLFSEAEDAYNNSLNLGEDNPHHLAQVYHSLGNHLSKDRSRFSEAEDAYNNSLDIEIVRKQIVGKMLKMHIN